MFKRETKEMFVPAGKKNFFRASVRQQILLSLIESEPYEGGADVSKLLFPLQTDYINLSVSYRICFKSTLFILLPLFSFLPTSYAHCLFLFFLHLTLDLGLETEAGIVTKFFPAHTAARRNLMTNWAKVKTLSSIHVSSHVISQVTLRNVTCHCLPVRICICVYRGHPATSGT